MTTFRARSKTSDALGIIEIHPEGAYLLIFENGDCLTPKFDYLQDDLEMAKIAAEDLGFTIDSWAEDESWEKIM